MTHVMKNEEVTRQCAVSLSNLAASSIETHEFLVDDGGIGALVNLASHGLVVEEEKEGSSSSSNSASSSSGKGRSSSLRSGGGGGGGGLSSNDGGGGAWDEDENERKKHFLEPMNTLLTRVPPRALKKLQSIDGIESIVPMLDKEVKEKRKKLKNFISSFTLFSIFIFFLKRPFDTFLLFFSPINFLIIRRRNEWHQGMMEYLHQEQRHQCQYFQHWALIRQRM